MLVAGPSEVLTTAHPGIRRRAAGIPAGMTNPTGPGATGGLPGEHADERTLELSADERADTVAATGDTAAGEPTDDADAAENG